jgi:outer membrane protein TolC
MTLCARNDVKLGIFFFFFWFWPLLSQTALSNDGMSLKEAITEGLTISPFLKLQEKNMDAKKAEVSKAWSHFLPHSQFEIGRGRQSTDNYYTKLQRRRLNDSLVVGADTIDTSVEPNFAFLTIGSEIDLFKGFGNFHNLKEKQAEQGIAEHEFSIEQNNLIFNITRAYIDLLNLETTLDFLKKAKLSAEEQERNFKKRVEVGISPKSDLERAEERVLELDWQELKANQARGVAQSKFNQLLGRPLPSPTQLEPLHLKNNLTPKAIDHYLGNVRYNLDFAKSRLEAAKDRYVKRKTYAGHLGMPNIKFEHNYEERGDKFNTVEGAWKFGVVAKIPIFDGMSNFSEQQKAQASLRSSLIKSKIALENAEIDIRNHHTNWHVLDRYIKFLNKKRTRQQGIYDQTKTALKEKAATAAQLNAAEVLVLETETELLKTKRLQFLDFIKLEMLTGEISHEELFQTAFSR